MQRAFERSDQEHFPVSMLHDFAVTNVPQLTESELVEFERVLLLDQPLLLKLSQKPGQCPFFLGQNYTLDRFLNMVRHRIGTQEYR